MIGWGLQIVGGELVMIGKMFVCDFCVEFFQCIEKLVWIVDFGNCVYCLILQVCQWLGLFGLQVDQCGWLQGYGMDIWVFNSFEIVEMLFGFKGIVVDNDKIY